MSRTFEGRGSVFHAFEKALKEDGINPAQTCVIEKGGNGEKASSGPDVLKTLKRVEQELPAAHPLKEQKTMKSVLEVAADRAKAGRRAAVVIVIRTKGSTPRKVGTKMLVDVDGTTVGTIGGGDLEKRVVETALEAIAEETPRLISFTLDRDKGNLDMMCGGEIDFYIDPILPAGTGRHFRSRPYRRPILSPHV